MSDQQNPASNERRHVPEHVIAEINSRLDKGDQRFASLEQELRDNTEATKKIAENTAGLVRLTTELEAGTKFLCRVALGIRFMLKEVIEPFWKPALIVSVVIYYMTHDHQLPQWIGELIKMAGG